MVSLLGGRVWTTYRGLSSSSGTSPVERACIREPIGKILCQSFGMSQRPSQLTFLSLFSSLRYRRVSALYAYQLRCFRPDLQEVRDGRNIRNEDCPRGPLAGRKALYTSLNCGIDEVFLDGARWILLSGNEREHCVHFLQYLRQLLRVFVVCLNPYYTLGGRASRSILCRPVSCKDPAIDTSADNMRTFLDRSKILCFLAATRTSMISCATSAEPSVTLQIRHPQTGGEPTAGAACNSNLDHFL